MCLSRRLNAVTLSAMWTVCDSSFQVLGSASEKLQSLNLYVFVAQEVDLLNQNECVAIDMISFAEVSDGSQSKAMQNISVIGSEISIYAQSRLVALWLIQVSPRNNFTKQNTKQKKDQTFLGSMLNFLRPIERCFDIVVIGLLLLMCNKH